MGNGSVMATLTTDTAEAVRPILDAVAQAPEVQAARAEVDRLTQEIGAWRERRAAVTTAEATTDAHATALREARMALLMAQLAGEAIDPAELATSTTDLLAATLALEDAATQGRLADDKLRTLATERDAASRAAARAEVEVLTVAAEAQPGAADTQLADACASAAVWTVLQDRIARLATQYGGHGARHPRSRVEEAVAYAFRPIYFAGRGAAPLAASARVHATPHADAFEWERQRQAAEPAPPPKAAGVTTSDDGWTRRG
jgi:hypothetical protein